MALVNHSKGQFGITPGPEKTLFTISPQSCLFSSLLGCTIAHLEYFVFVPSVQMNSPSISLSESPIHAFRFNLANWDLHECVQQEVVFLLWFNFYQVSSGFFARPHQRHAMFYSRGTIWSTSCQTISTLRNILKWVAKPGRKDGAFFAKQAIRSVLQKFPYLTTKIIIPFPSQWPLLLYIFFFSEIRRREHIQQVGLWLLCSVTLSKIKIITIQ